MPHWSTRCASSMTTCCSSPASRSRAPPARARRRVPRARCRAVAACPPHRFAQLLLGVGVQRTDVGVPVQRAQFAAEFVGGLLGAAFHVEGEHHGRDDHDGDALARQHRLGPGHGGLAAAGGQRHDQRAAVVEHRSPGCLALRLAPVVEVVRWAAFQNGSAGSKLSYIGFSVAVDLADLRRARVRRRRRRPRSEAGGAHSRAAIRSGRPSAIGAAEQRTVSHCSTVGQCVGPGHRDHGGCPPYVTSAISSTCRTRAATSSHPAAGRRGPAMRI